MAAIEVICAKKLESDIDVHNSGYRKERVRRVIGEGKKAEVTDQKSIA